MEFWQGFVIGVIVTQIFLGFVLVKAGVIADVIRYLESGLTKRALDSAPPYTAEELDIITDPRRNGALRNPPSQ